MPRLVAVGIPGLKAGGCQYDTTMVSRLRQEYVYNHTGEQLPMNGSILLPPAPRGVWGWRESCTS